MADFSSLTGNSGVSFTLDQPTFSKVKKLSEAYERGELGNPPVQQPRRNETVFDYEFGIPASAITGVTALGAPPQSGNVNLYTFTGSGGTTAMGRFVEAFNFSTVDMTTTMWVHLKRHERSGRYVIQGTYENQCIKPLVRVVLSTSINQATSSVSAKVTDQYGLGLQTSTTITIRNLEISSGHLFAGSTGHAGYAMPTATTDGRLTMLECT